MRSTSPMFMHSERTALHHETTEGKMKRRRCSGTWFQTVDSSTAHVVNSSISKVLMQWGNSVSACIRRCVYRDQADWFITCQSVAPLRPTGWNLKMEVWSVNTVDLFKFSEAGLHYDEHTWWHRGVKWLREGRCGLHVCSSIIMCQRWREVTDEGSHAAICSALGYVHHSDLPTNT